MIYLNANKAKCSKITQTPLWVATHALPWTPGGIWASVHVDSKR